MAQTTTRKTPTGQPQDHKVKAEEGYGFIGKDGKRYVLPPASEGLNNLDFGTFMDLAELGDDGSVQLAFAIVRSMTIPAPVMKALRGLPMKEGAEVMGAWFTATSGGATLPQS